MNLFVMYKWVKKIVRVVGVFGLEQPATCSQRRYLNALTVQQDDTLYALNVAGYCRRRRRFAISHKTLTYRCIFCVNVRIEGFLWIKLYHASQR